VDFSPPGGSIGMTFVRHTSRILLVLLTLVPLARADDPKAPPTLNETVLEFARDKIGQVIGDGECTALVTAAFREAGARRFPPFGADADFVWGERLDAVKDAKPGDVLQFRDAVFKGRKMFRNGTIRYWEYRYLHHTAIVADVKKTKSGWVVTVLHQNVSNTDNPSKAVRRDSLNMAELQPGGEVVAYRPVAK
jgi:hypothetical protein